jgi:bifunctional DNA-binding transcriptional regulator/antitoxin component of YhaV-PrlF toxin-antitoxin module
VPPSGFGEQAQAAFEGVPAAGPAGLAEQPASASTGARRLLKLGPDGRVLLPADLRKAMRLRDGDNLVATVAEDGVLTLWGTDVGLDKLRKLVAPYVPDGSVVEEFLKDRRAIWGEEG